MYWEADVINPETNLVNDNYQVLFFFTEFFPQLFLFAFTLKWNTMLHLEQVNDHENDDLSQGKREEYYHGLAML